MTRFPFPFNYSLAFKALGIRLRTSLTHSSSFVLDLILTGSSRLMKTQNFMFCGSTVQESFLIMMEIYYVLSNIVATSHRGQLNP